jgi:hypothetical protein
LRDEVQRRSLREQRETARQASREQDGIKNQCRGCRGRRHGAGVAMVPCDRPSESAGFVGWKRDGQSRMPGAMNGRKGFGLIALLERQRPAVFEVIPDLQFIG